MAMADPRGIFCLFRLSNLQKESQDKHARMMREHVEAAREVLRSNPRPDTFLGRKTHEPFPQDDNPDGLT
ncbi:hypothetical protein [Bradyrhizobium zhanjiangense]|uniref:Uncharacterized protein n=1 Tax=Bradyrhizobium zhanjiangense TaxID=1325107 RepID=A0A4Q0STX2_9BRAD|nr:hypothetical protein [Bradyrhizobium zhanjiangense]RXH41621.1 hypothetical protein XH94_06400 [Bradyrhizobium zhanjiangense]